MCESKNVVLKYARRMWRDPASLLISRIRMELGPLGPAPAHFGLSFHDGLDVRLRGGIRRAGEESSFFNSPCKEVAGSIADVGTAWSFYRHIDAPGGAIAIGVT